MAGGGIGAWGLLKFKGYLGQTHFVVYFILLLLLTCALVHLSLYTPLLLT